MRVNGRVRHRLELQAIDLEELFARNDLRAQVEGGAIESEGVTYQIHLQVPLTGELCDQIQADLAESFSHASLRATPDPNAWEVTLGKRHNIDLCTMLESGLDLAPRVAALGYLENDTPLLLNFNDPALEQVIFTGAGGAGKTAALRTVAVSLALSSRQSQIQMLIIDPLCDRPELPLGPGLHALHYLPHALAAVVTDADDAADVLRYLDDEARYRRTHAVRSPTITLFMDNLDILLSEGSKALRKSLERLLANGAESGIHCIMSSRPDGGAVADLISLKPVLRVVGSVRNETDARAVSGQIQTGAENLLGKGDFLLIREDEPLRFQSAFVDPYDLHWCLESLQRNRPPAILARPASARPVYGPPRPQNGSVQSFTFDGRQISLPEDVEARRR